jgi:hypothetical protein
MTLFQTDELESSGALPSFRSVTTVPAEIQNYIPFPFDQFRTNMYTISSRRDDASTSISNTRMRLLVIHINGFDDNPASRADVKGVRPKTSCSCSFKCQPLSPFRKAEMVNAVPQMLRMPSGGEHQLVQSLSYLMSNPVKGIYQ